MLAKLSQATQRVMNDSALRAKLESQAMFVDLHAGQAAAKAFVQAEREKLRPVVAALGDALRR